MHPLEWLPRMADHIPDPGKQSTLFYSYYANRVRGKILDHWASARRRSPSLRQPYSEVVRVPVDVSGHIAKADANWPKIEDKRPSEP